MTKDHTGRCLCGAVRYRLAGEPLHSVICHCVSCRRASGAPTVAWLTFDRKGFEILAGEPATFRSSAGVSRRFCGTCGSALTYESDKSPGSIDVTTGTLDEPGAFPPTAEVWLDHRVRWQPTDPALGQFTGSSDGPE
jgi:hypothetical protein